MLAPLLAAALAQSPAAPPAPPPPDPARAAWDAFQERMAAAQALHLEAALTLLPPEPAPDAEADAEADEAEDRTIRLELAVRVAQPGAGTVTMRGKVEDPAGGEEEEIVLHFLGTREGVHFADPQQQFAMWEAERWSGSQFGAFLPFLGPAWCQEGFVPSAVAALPAPAEQADWTGLRVEGADAFATPVILELWFDGGGALRRSSSPIPDGGSLEIVFRSFEALAEADAEAYWAEIPEDWEVMSRAEMEGEEEDAGGGLEDSLLPVGAAAPPASFLGMDEAEFSLESLRGKTVLLNFWFFH